MVPGHDECGWAPSNEGSNETGGRSKSRVSPEKGGGLFCNWEADQSGARGVVKEH